MQYYSQYKQDKILHETIFKNKKDGVFVELGAGDGIRFSNTYFFELQGWSGLCIEPNPFEFNKLKNNRKCIIENILISTKKYDLDFLAINGEGKGLSGVIENYDQRHSNRIKTSGEVTGEKNVIKVPTTTLEDLFDKHEINDIDYFSLDVEGSELDVLNSINFSKVKIKYITIENNYGNEEETKLLINHGYKKIKRIGIDDLFKKI